MSQTKPIKDLLSSSYPSKSELPASLPMRQPTWQQEIIERYKTGENLLCLFNPSNQAEYFKNEERCFTGHAPSVVRVARTFGENVAETWLAIQLFDLATFTSIKKPNDTFADYLEIARIIIAGYGDFKLTEFMVFFQRFKQGLYGTFYGKFDPMVITRALRQFKSEREALLKRYEDKRRQQERQQQWEESQRNSLTYEEWQELRWLFNMGYERKDLKQN